MTQKLIRITYVPYVCVTISDFEGTLEEVSNRILNIRQELAEAIKHVSKHRKDITPISSYAEIKINIGRDYDGGSEVNLECFREQTEEEKQLEKVREKVRKEAAKKAAITKAEAKEKREKTLYENLKKKFETI